MVPAGRMCRKHLLGEHVEIHMLLGTLKRGRSIAGFLSKGLLEPVSLKERHDALVAEMEIRGYSHRSPISGHEFRKVASRFSEIEKTARVNGEKSIEELYRRCAECKNHKLKP